MSSSPPTKDGRPTPSFKAVAKDALLRAKQLKTRKPRNARTTVGSRKIYTRSEANLLLGELVRRGGPKMVARLGTTETSVIKYFVDNHAHGLCVFPEVLKSAIQNLSGVFPPTDVLLSQFCREALSHLEEVDFLGVRDRPSEWEFWETEDFFATSFLEEAELLPLETLMPIGDPGSWTSSLAGKRVLVLHPFSQTIYSQFARRADLFPNSDFLPDFDLSVIQAVQGLGESSQELPFRDWFDALDSMKEAIQRSDFDVALIGAGAYGLFLAAEVKRQRRTAIQVGGALQLLFGISGKRWSDPNSPDSADVLPHINESWVTPRQSEVPNGAHKVEGGCYWA